MRQNSVKGYKDCGLQASFDCSIREAILGDFPAIVEEEKKVLESSTISETEGKFMTRFGWEFPRNHSSAIKYEHVSGKVIAHEGDETWDRDLRVARE